MVSIDVSLEALLGYTPPAVEERRNPFRFGPADDAGRDLAAAGASGAVPAAVAQLLNSPAASPPLPTLAPPAPPSAAPLRFIGIVEVRAATAAWRSWPTATASTTAG